MEKKKILIFGLTSLIGGVETYIINLVRHIDKEKFDIDFLVQDDITGINKEKILGYYTNIYKVENLKRHPIKAIKTLRRIYTKNKYDVIHLNISTASSILYAIPCKSVSPKTKIIVHSHNGGDKNKLQHYFFRGVLNNFVDKYLACSKLAAEWMFGKKIVESNKVIIVKNAIETDKFLYNIRERTEIRESLKIQEKDFLVGHVGRFNPQKNHIGIIKILKEIVKEDNDIKLMLIGTGELEYFIRQKVKEFELEDKVIFLGTKSDINKYYQAMDLFILPSIFEGLPIVGIEAQASGLKCIFSDSITKESNITNNVDFINIENVNKWKNRIIELKYSNYRRENVKELIIKNGYDLEEEIEKIESMYIG